MGSRSHNSRKTRYERNKRRATALLMQMCDCGQVATHENCNRQWKCGRCYAGTYESPFPRIKVNKPCFCGSGVKFKYCHSETALKEQDFLEFLEKNNANPDNPVSIDDYVGGDRGYQPKPRSQSATVSMSTDLPV